MFEHAAILMTAPGSLCIGAIYSLFVSIAQAFLFTLLETPEIPLQVRGSVSGRRVAALGGLVVLTPLPSIV